jgi:hypothetical protein
MTTVPFGIRAGLAKAILDISVMVFGFAGDLNESAQRTGDRPVGPRHLCRPAFQWQGARQTDQWLLDQLRSAPIPP